jgi:TolB-like protein/Tfp pilus assembly protein PilF
VDLRKFFSEVQRRHVGKTAGVYAVVGWVGIQVAATVFPLLDVSDVATKIVVILIIVGFPIAIALAWAYDLTSSGLQRTAPLRDDATPSVTHSGSREYGRALSFFGIGILVSLGAFAALSSVRHDRAGRTAEGIRSIAVLPFEDLSEKHDQGYFTNGITEELLNRLTQIPDLKVPGRTSSFAFRSSSLGAAEIGAKLDVEALLEGSVRREGDEVRVSVRLIDARTEHELWADEYTREVSSIFAIQEEIAADIVGKLKLQINPQPTVAGADADINADPAAVDAYMKGLDLWNKRTEESMRRAVEYFEQAVAKDPNFALGYAMVAQAYALLPAYGDFPVFEASSKGQAAAARSLELNPSQPEAYAALGQIRQNFEWDFESAERSYRRAILFNNGYATAHQWRAEALLFLGDYEESRKEVDEALNLDPASPAALHVKAYQHITRRELAAANRTLDRLLTAHPDFPLALVSKTSVAIMSRQPIGAQPVMRRLTRANPVYANAVEMAGAAAIDPARRDAAKQAISALEGRRSMSEVALWYALAGLNDEAMAALKNAYDSGSDVNLPLLLLHPAFDAIRARPDYQLILSELHMVAE